MNKAKTNALESLRALISERQQYEQWISALESRREGTPPHVFEKVHGDYNTRLQRVVTDIKGHAEELQLSISTLSSRLVEVAREEDTRRDALQEAELRAAVGEYEPQQWEQRRTEAESGLEKIAGDRASLDSQLGELRSIQKLSEAGSVGEVMSVAEAGHQPEATATSVSPAEAEATSGAAEIPAARQQEAVVANPVSAQSNSDQPSDNRASPSQSGPTANSADAPEAVLSAGVVSPAKEQGRLPFGQPRAGSAAPVPQPAKPRTGKTPPFGSSAARPKPPEPRDDQSKTLKCPECGTPNYATEWYCERCGGELATM